MGLSVSWVTSRFVRLLQSFGIPLKIAIMATIAGCHFHVLCEAERKSKLLRRAVRLAIFPKHLADFEERKSNKQLGRISRKYRLLPYKVEKIRLTPATSCQDREFSIPCEKRPIKPSGLSFPQKASAFREERKAEAFWNWYSKPSI